MISQGAWRGREGVMEYLARFGAPGLDEGELNEPATCKEYLQVREYLVKKGMDRTRYEKTIPVFFIQFNA